MSRTSGYAIDTNLPALITSLGGRHDDVLRLAKLPEDTFSRPGARVSSEQFFDLMGAIEACIDDPLLALRMVEGLRAEWFSPVCFAALCSPDLRCAAERIARFKPLVAPVVLRVEAHADGLRVVYEFEAFSGRAGTTRPAFLAQTALLLIVKLGRMGTQRPLIPSEVTLPERPRAREEFEAFLGCRIDRGPVSRVCFRPEDAQRPFVTNNTGMWDFFEPEFRARLAAIEGRSSFAERTRSALLEALPAGVVTLDAVARRLAVSSRTLQRRLREEETSFRDVLRELREQLSRHYLRQPELSFAEIAYLLGYEEPNSYFRAVRAWTGRTPQALRKALRREEKR